MYGTKVGMTTVFNEAGESLPVTVILMPPNVVYQVKTAEKDAYRAVQIGIGERKAQRVTKAETKHFSAAQKGLPQHVKEIRLDKYFVGSQFNVGDEIKVDETFEKGAKVDISGISIGKGHAGVIKRHGMKGAQTNTHGTHEYFRHGGSIGNRKFPGRVFKGKRMTGHMGVDKITQEALEVVEVIAEDNVLLVRGSIPGADNQVVFVRNSVKNKKGTTKK